MSAGRILPLLQVNFAGHLASSKPSAHSLTPLQTRPIGMAVPSLHLKSGPGHLLSSMPSTQSLYPSQTSFASRMRPSLQPNVACGAAPPLLAPPLSAPPLVAPPFVAPPFVAPPSSSPIFTGSCAHPRATRLKTATLMNPSCFIEPPTASKLVPRDW